MGEPRERGGQGLTLSISPRRAIICFRIGDLIPSPPMMRSCVNHSPLLFSRVP